MSKNPNSWQWLSRLLKASASVLPLLVLTAVAFAADQAAPVAPAPGQPQSPGMMGMLMPFLLMFGVIWLMILRPQQKRMKEQQAVLTSLKHGDEVLTSSGILGKITGITDKVVTVEVADGVRVKMLKSQVAQVLKGPIKDLA
jgi:preprotein translocase subunit YajC